MKQFTILTIFVLFAGTTLMAQSARSDYFMQNSYTRSSMNPAFMPLQGYVGVPALSGLAVESRTNSLYLDNFLFDKNGGKVTFLHPSVSSSEFLANMPDISNFAVNMNYQPISFGFFTRSGGFWNFSIGVKTVGDLNIPKPLFELAKKGFTSEDHEVSYPVRDLRMSVRLYSEITAGYARTFLDNKLSVGARAKLLVGAAYIDMNIESLDVTARKDRWTARSKAYLKGSGIKAKYDENGLFESVEDDLSGVGGFGLGLDLGAVYNVFDRAKVSLAITDLGFISWNKSSSINLKTPETLVTVYPGGESAMIEEDFDFKESFDSSIDDIKESINFKGSSSNEGQVTTLYTTVNAGFEYEVLPGNLSAGLLSSTYLGMKTETELTLSANYNPARLRWLSAALTYSFMYGRFNTCGIALHLAPSKVIHFFVAGDYMVPTISGQFLPVRSKAVNVQFGFAIPIGKKRID
ncbi:MAG: DUF5723 family protein [Tannerellaceae bacterium]|nr:DUF5723 family protein [Tannerellaceae bacterium]